VEWLPWARRVLTTASHDPSSARTLARPCLLVTSLKGGDHPCFIVHDEKGWRVTTTDVHNAMRRLGYKSHRQFVVHAEGYLFVSQKHANELIMTHIAAGAWHIPRRPS